MQNLQVVHDEIKARWVRVSTEMLDHEILDNGPYDRRSAWLWLLANAAWKERRINHKGRPLTLARGQLLGGRKFLAEKWGWTEKQVRTFLELLMAEGMLGKGQSKGHFANVITISNYDRYQSSDKSDDQSKGQSRASAGPEQGQTLTRYTKVTNNTPRVSARGDADELARQAYLDGLRIKHGAQAKSGRAAVRCRGELDGSNGVLLDAGSGKLTVDRTAAADLSADFPGIDIAAACDRAAPGVMRMNYPSAGDALAEIRKWARILADDKRPASTPVFEDFKARRVRDAQEAMAALQGMQ